MTNDAEIVCPLSRWYFMRYGLLVAVLAGMGLFFLYDGAIGYPKKNLVADLHDAFIATKEGADWQPPADAGEPSAEHLTDLEQARQAARDGTSWARFAAPRRLSDHEPKRYGKEAIKQQYDFAILMAVVAAVIAAWLVARRHRSFRADGEAMTFPNGTRVPFSEVRQIDLRRWERGMGRVIFASAEGAERSAKVDDYKFAGSGEILRRACESNPELTLEGDRRWLFPAEANGSADASSD